MPTLGELIVAQGICTKQQIEEAARCQVIFGGLLGSPGLLLLWHTAFMALVVWIVARGVTKGLESAVRTLMPALFILQARPETVKSPSDDYAFPLSLKCVHLLHDTHIDACADQEKTVQRGVEIELSQGGFVGGPQKGNQQCRNQPPRPKPPPGITSYPEEQSEPGGNHQDGAAKGTIVRPHRPP